MTTLLTYMGNADGAPKTMDSAAGYLSADVEAGSDMADDAKL